MKKKKNELTFLSPFKDFQYNFYSSDSPFLIDQSKGLVKMTSYRYLSNPEKEIRYLSNPEKEIVLIFKIVVLLLFAPALLQLAIEYVFLALF